MVRINHYKRIFKYVLFGGNFSQFCQMNRLFALQFTVKNYREISEIIKGIERQQKKISDFITEINWDAFWDEKNTDYDTLPEKIVNKAIDSTGKPDYFVWNDYIYYFVEYKSNTDSLRPAQLDWYVKYKEFPILVLHSTKSSILCKNTIISAPLKKKTKT